MENRLSRYKSWYESAISHPGWANWLKEHVLDRQFYDGDQLTQEERAAMEERGQPPIVANIIFSKINNLLGALIFRNSRIGAKPRTSKDRAAAQAISDIFLHIEDRNGMEFINEGVFEDGIIEGIGWYENYIAVDELGMAEVRVEHEDPKNMFMDPLCRKPDLSDARFVGRHKWIDLEDAKALFPGKTFSNAEATSSIVDRGRLDDYDMKNGTSYVSKDRRRVRLVELWYRSIETVTWQLRDGVQTYIPPGVVPRDPLQNKQVLLDQEKMWQERRKVVHKVIFDGEQILSDLITPYTHPLNINRFPFTPFIAFWKKKTGEPYGYVRPMRDIAAERNKRRSKALHILNTSQVIADAEAVADIEKLREEASRPDGILLKRQGTELRIQRDTNLATTQFNIMLQSDQDIQHITGIFDEAQGAQTNARTGAAIYGRQSASNQNNAVVFQRFRRARLYNARFIYGLIKQYYTEERTFLITDERGEREVVINGDNNGLDRSLKEGIMDIVIDSLPATATANEEQFKYLVEAAKSGIPIPPDIIIQASNLRDKEAIIKRLQQAPQGAQQGGQR